MVDYVTDILFTALTGSSFRNHMDRVHWPLHLLCLKKGEGRMVAYFQYIEPQRHVIITLILFFKKTKQNKTNNK